MKPKNILPAVLAIALFVPAAFADLTGRWSGDDGGTYYLRQVDGSLYWYGEDNATNPGWSNVFSGTILIIPGALGRPAGTTINGKWADVPKGRAVNHGELSLKIVDAGKVLEISRKTGAFSGNRLTRSDAQIQGEAVGRPAGPLDRPATSGLASPGAFAGIGRAAGETAGSAAPGAQIGTPAGQPAEPTTPVGGVTFRPRIPPTLAPIAVGSLKEDCVSFNPAGAAVQRIDGRWKIVDGNHWVFDFGDKQDEARQALRIVRHYRANHSCYVGRPDPSFSYLLVAGAAPAGALKGEDCVDFSPATANVAQIQGRWKIVDGSHWLFDFADKEAEARTALRILKHHGFTRSCFVGRPDPSLTYLRK